MENSNKEQLKKITIYTDGACSGNPGRGGWAAILICNTKDKHGKDFEYKKTISGGAENTTNNKMELTAVIEALKILKTRCEIDLYTDSKYVLEGATKWLENWKNHNWKTSGKQSVKNQDLWTALDELLEKQNVNWHWVKGHSGDKYNEMVDVCAKVHY